MVTKSDQQTCKILLFLLILSLNIIFTRCCDDEDFYIIRSQAQYGMVLDGGDPTYIKIQPFAGFSTQFWKLEPGSRAGLFYIINKCTGTALDVEYKSDIDSWKILLKNKSSSLDQQWELRDNGRIMNVAKQYNIDIYNAQYHAGNTVNIWKDNGHAAQRYILQKAPRCSECHNRGQHL